MRVAQFKTQRSAAAFWILMSHFARLRAQAAFEFELCCSWHLALFETASRNPFSRCSIKKKSKGSEEREVEVERERESWLLQSFLILQGRTRSFSVHLYTYHGDKTRAWEEEGPGWSRWPPEAAANCRCWCSDSAEIRWLCHLGRYSWLRWFRGLLRFLPGGCLTLWFFFLRSA